MKIGKETSQRIETIKVDALEAQRTLMKCIIRLQEHAGTKRITSKLQRTVEGLDKWIRET